MVLGLFVAVQSHAAEKETIVKSLLEQYDKEIASLDGKISKLEKTIETGDLVTRSPLDMGTPVHVEATNDMSEEFTITGQINDSNKPSNIIKKDTNNKQSDPLKTEKAKLESEKIKQDIQSNKYTGRGPPSWREHILSLKANPNDQLEYDKQSDLLKTEKGKLESEKIKQDIQFEIDITKGREVLTEHQKAMYEHLWVEPFDPMDPMEPMEPLEPKESLFKLKEKESFSFKLKEKEKKINQLDPLKTEKAKSESEKIKQDIQDKKNKQLGTIISDSSEYRGKTIVKDPRDLKELQKMFQSAWKDLQPAEKATARSLGWSESLWKKRKKNIELLKTEKGKLESEKIRLAVQLNKYIDKKNLEQKIIDTQTKTKKKTKTETRKALKKALSELKKAKKKKKILKKKKKVRKKKEVVNRKPVNKKKVIKRKPVKKKKVIKRKPVKKKKVIKRKPVKKKKKTRKKKEKSKK